MENEQYYPIADYQDDWDPRKEWVASDGARVRYGNWWVHKFVYSSGPTTVTNFQVNHVNTMIGETERRPNNSIGYSIEAAEADLASMGATDDSNWYIQRINSNTIYRWYKVHHNSAVSDRCPGSSPGYPKLQDISDNKRLSKIENSNTRPITCS